MLARMFKKILALGVPLALLSAVIGCSANKGNIGGVTGGGSVIEETGAGMVSPLMSSSNYSTTLGNLSTMGGDFVAGKCKNSDGSTKSGSWALPDASFKLVKNDVDCKLLLTSIKLASASVAVVVNGVSTPTNITSPSGFVFTNEGVEVSNTDYSVTTKFTCGDCIPSAYLYARSHIKWTNGVATIATIYATDPGQVVQTGKGSYAMSTVISNSSDTNAVPTPDYSVSYSAGLDSTALTIDAGGYVQPGVGTDCDTGPCFTFTKGSVEAEYVRVFNSGNPQAMNANPLTDTHFASPAGKYTDFKDYFYNNSSYLDQNVHPNLLGNWGSKLDPDILKFPLVTTNPTGAWGFIQPVSNSGAQPCAPATYCDQFDVQITDKILNTYKRAGDYNIPTLIPASGLNYYVVFYNVDHTTLDLGVQIFLLSIQRP